MYEYKIWQQGAGEEECDARTFNADDAYQAVIRWAEWHDEVTHNALIINDSPVEVSVRHSDGITRFVVYGERVAQYSPKMLRDD